MFKMAVLGKTMHPLCAIGHKNTGHFIFVICYCFGCFKMSAMVAPKRFSFKTHNPTKHLTWIFICIVPSIKMERPTITVLCGVMLIRAPPLICVSLELVGGSFVIDLFSTNSCVRLKTTEQRQVCRTVR